MKALVAYASKYNSTKEIADVIGLTLNEIGVTTDVKHADEVTDITYYDAVIIGSAVYAGRWLKPAVRFVEESAKDLTKRQVWLFSSGPLGNQLNSQAKGAVEIEPILALTHAKEHKLFPGKLTKGELNFAERAMVFAVGGKEGDYRDWDDITEWTKKVARSLAKISR